MVTKTDAVKTVLSQIESGKVLPLEEAIKRAEAIKPSKHNNPTVAWRMHFARFGLVQKTDVGYVVGNAVVATTPEAKLAVVAPEEPKTVV